VTATREPVPLERQPYSVLLVDRDRLAAGESVADALARSPEVYMQMPGGRTGFGSLFLRGADPNFTTVLLEGVPLDSPTNSRGGAVNLSALPSAAIDRAELVAGPASTLYGSGALAGALNLLLAPPSAAHRLTLGGTVGTQEELSAFARWQGSLAGGYGGSLTGVIDDAGTAQPQSRFRSRGADLRIGRLDGSAGSLLVHLAGTTLRGFPDSSGGFDRAVIRDVERRESDEVIVALDQPLVRLGKARIAIAVSYSSRGDRVETPGVAPSEVAPSGVPAGVDDIRYRRGIVRPSVALDLGDWHATLGGQGQWESARSEGTLDFGFPVPARYDRSRTTWSGFAELGGSTGTLAVNAGMRLDDIEGIGTRWTGRAGLRYALGAGVSLRAAAGTAFKAPSFYALANPFIGNAALRPESATAVEAGLDWQSLSLTVFRTRYRDLIDFIPVDPPRLDNRARVTAQGVSASLSHRLGKALIGTASVQYVETEDGATGGQLLNRPRWRGAAELEWAAARVLTFHGRYAYTDARDDYAIPTGVLRLAPMHRLSASAVWRVTPQISLRLDGDNLLQDRGEDAIGFPALPRRVRISFTQSIGH